MICRLSADLLQMFHQIWSRLKTDLLISYQSVSYKLHLPIQSRILILDKTKMAQLHQNAPFFCPHPAKDGWNPNPQFPVGTL